MSVIRLLLAWLLLAALPLQGFAAATTLLCGPAHHGAAAIAAEAAPATHHHDALRHDAGKAHQHDHADTAAELHDGQPQEPGHSCSLCSAACHGVGIASQSTQVALADAPLVPLSEAFQRFDSRPAPVPDKPPRA